MPEVSVIVPARDAERYVPRLVTALAALEHDGEPEMIFVDNGSADATARLAEDSRQFTHVIRRPRGEGPGAARNEGARCATGRTLAFVDADCRPTAGWLRAGIAALESADLVQGRVLPDPTVAPGPFDRTLAVTEDHGLFESANLIVTRELFERLGGFPAGLEPPGLGRAGAPFGEDCLFGWAARRAGARTTFCDAALVHHVVIQGGPAAAIAEQARLRMFPELTRLVPELREALLYRRAFLSPRSAAFDAAILGLAAALITRAPLALALGGPYARALGGRALAWGPRRAPAIAALDVLADLVGAVGLVRGSIESRTLVL